MEQFDKDGDIRSGVHCHPAPLAVLETNCEQCGA
jgi:hypothetical protein